MLDLHPAVLSAFVGLLGIVLLVFAWRSVSSLPGLARWSLRLVLAAIIVVPFALLVLTPRYEMARAPEDAQVAPRMDMDGETSTPATTSAKKRAYKRMEERAPDGGSAPEAAAPEFAERPRPPSHEEMAAQEPAPPPPEAVPTTPPEAAPPPAPEAVPDIAAPGSPDSMPGLGWSGTGGGGGGGTGAGRIGTNGAGSGPDAPEAANGHKSGPPQPPAAANGDTQKDAARGAEPSPVESERNAEAAPPAAAAGEEKEDWTVVPVYYGTDRTRVPNDKRIEYGSDRGRHLELGRAMVSVPKAHEVPQVERPWAITIPYFNYKLYEQAEDPKQHFVIQEIRSMPEADLLALVKERLEKSARFKDHAFVFVHGYNTSFDYAVYRAAQIAYDIKFDGAPFVYSWPSGGGIASYTYDRESSAQAEPYFTDFLKMVTQKSGAKHVSVIAHSMGNQLLLRVLQDLQRTRPAGVEISQIIFAAPDVDRDSFESIASGLKDFASGGITLYAASNDRALSVSKRFYGGVPRAGDVPTGGPLIVPGIDTIDATAVSMDSLGLHHSGYAESNALLQDIGLLIQTGERPPGKRVPILQQVNTAKGDYWRYPSSP